MTREAPVSEDRGNVEAGGMDSNRAEANTAANVAEQAEANTAAGTWPPEVVARARESLRRLGRPDSEADTLAYLEPVRGWADTPSVRWCPVTLAAARSRLARRGQPATREAVARSLEFWRPLLARGLRRAGALPSGP